ncbi:rab9 effector protein with kelch motifs [Entelurus aequoreus]|uniref:rab9 effector protein with kelch motifs n=1 Tax=Entelurus aequoreus TaxID=161455 RepID=UPI002B1D1177|nr:rab9 effector protein with kelch motifs [Entelurus aequoreus]
MELLPALDAQKRPKEGIWYSLIPGGGSPGVSVGHTCTFCPCEDGSNGKVLIVGGANPCGSFSRTHAINMDYLEWDILEWKGLAPRYEHCAFVPQSHPQSLWVFGGAEQTGNRNCMQKIQVAESKAHWEDIATKGEPPSPRTYHTNSACLGNALYVFAGGEAGASPVSDNKLHVFDTVSSTWTQPETYGAQPAARHGHVTVAAGSKIYIHGGMAGDELYDDMYSLDTGNMTWEMVQPKGDIPPAVAAHSAMALGNKIHIFGGMTAVGASNAMYRFNTEQNSWTLMKFEGYLPSARLDHCMCLLPWKVDTGGSGEQTAYAPAIAPFSALTPAKLPAQVKLPASETASIPPFPSNTSETAPVPTQLPASETAIAPTAETTPTPEKAPASDPPQEKASIPNPAEGPLQSPASTQPSPMPPFPSNASAGTVNSETALTPANAPASSQTSQFVAVPSATPAGIVNLAFVFGGMDTQGIIHNDCVVTVVT